MKLTKEKSFFGLPIYRKYRSSTKLRRTFLLGMLSENTIFNISGEIKKQFFLMGMLVLERRLTKTNISWLLWGKVTIKELSLPNWLNEELNLIFSNVEIQPRNGRKHVFIFWANSGEIAVLLQYFWVGLLKSKGIKAESEFVVLCTKQYHSDMLKLYNPAIQTCVKKPLVLRFLKGNMKTSEWDCTILFPGKYFAEFENLAETGRTINYFTWMKNWLGIQPKSTNFNDSQVVLTEDKLRKKNVPQKNLIILCTSSFSGYEVNPNLFRRIEEEFRCLGFSVYINETDVNSADFLTYPEIYLLGRKSFMIIGVRSGLLDFLSSTKTPIVALYTGFPDRGFNTPEKKSEQVLSMFSLGNLPNRASQCLELDVEKASEDEILKRIIIFYSYIKKSKE